MKLKIVVVVMVAFVLGLLVAGVAIFRLAPDMMVVENPSKLGFEETVQGVVEAAEQRGWKVPTVHRLAASMQTAGHEVLPAAMIELCRADYAARILADHQARFVTSLMPCRVAVYQTSDGHTIVSRMNTTLMSKLLGGLITEVMAAVSGDSEAIVGAVIER